MRHFRYFAGYSRLLEDFFEKTSTRIEPRNRDSPNLVTNILQNITFCAQNKKKLNRLTAFLKSVKRSSSKSDKYENCFYKVASTCMSIHISLYKTHSITWQSTNQGQRSTNWSNSKPKHFWDDKKQTSSGSKQSKIWFDSEDVDYSLSHLIIAVMTLWDKPNHFSVPHNSVSQRGLNFLRNIIDFEAFNRRCKWRSNTWQAASLQCWLCSVWQLRVFTSSLHTS